MTWLLRLLTGTSAAWVPEWTMDDYELNFDLDMPAGDAVWLRQVESIPVVPDFVPEEWL